MNDIARIRLANERLDGNPLESPTDVVRHLCAVQSQDFAGGKWAIALRCNGFDDAAITRMFNNGEILRTHIMRPTWHFVLPEDIRWLQALTSPRVNRFNAHYYAKAGLDDATFKRTNRAIAKALKGGEYLTRNEIADVLRTIGVDVSGNALANVVMRAELDCVVCSGPLRGKQFTYALLDERVPQTPARAHDESLAELTMRYFTSHGPATAHDFAWWCYLTVAEARNGIAMIRSTLETIDADGKTFFWRPTTTIREQLHNGRSGPVVHLLPNYDEHFVGFKNHKPLFDDVVSSALKDGPNALMAHIITSDGKIIGGWRRSIGSKCATIEPILLRRLSKREQIALEKALLAYERFLGMPVAMV
ncbi:MAG: AlkZ family DNA glycosylase [bacterium]|nr:AlkZ family DNA glycosylase [Candidatus Kapabacteria bacterium]